MSFIMLPGTVRVCNGMFLAEWPHEIYMLDLNMRYILVTRLACSPYTVIVYWNNHMLTNDAVILDVGAWSWRRRVERGGEICFRSTASAAPAYHSTKVLYVDRAAKI
jgi:hypothetical protein